MSYLAYKTKLKLIKLERDFNASLNLENYIAVRGDGGDFNKLQSTVGSKTSNQKSPPYPPPLGFTELGHRMGELHSISGVEPIESDKILPPSRRAPRRGWLNRFKVCGWGAADSPV